MYYLKSGDDNKEETKKLESKLETLHFKNTEKKLFF